MQLVILAAGEGSRLGHFTEGGPKSLVPISNNKTYLSVQFDAILNFDFSKKIIVGGFAFEKLQSYLSSHYPKAFEIVHNEDFKKGNLYSLLSAKNSITESFYIFNADHCYSLETYTKIFSPQIEDGITIFCDQDRNLTHDDMKVKIDDKAKFVEMAKTLHDFNWGYVGITHVPSQLQQSYWQACAAVAKTIGEKAHVEAVVNQMAKDGVKIKIADISGSWWTEIDTPEDYAKAKETILKNIKFSIN